MRKRAFGLPTSGHPRQGRYAERNRDASARPARTKRWTRTSQTPAAVGASVHTKLKEFRMATTGATSRELDARGNGVGRIARRLTTETKAGVQDHRVLGDGRPDRRHPRQCRSDQRRGQRDRRVHRSPGMAVRLDPRRPATSSPAVSRSPEARIRTRTSATRLASASSSPRASGRASRSLRRRLSGPRHGEITSRRLRGSPLRRIRDPDRGHASPHR